MIRLSDYTVIRSC